MPFRGLCGIFLFISLLSSAYALDETESAIRDAVNRGEQEALALLEQAVNINSGTMNTGGVKEVGELFAKAFADAGFATRWVDGAPFGRGGHLLAEHGSRGPKVLLIGHIDTVFAKDSSFQRFQRVDEHHAAGPGITDMKGGDVIILQAAKALDAAGVLDELQLRVILTGDEESRGRPLDVANAELIAAADWADIALGFEDGDGDPGTAVTARRSSSEWQLTVTGKPAHSSQIFREDIGFGAALEAARILDGWRKALSAIPNLTFNPGLVMAGTDMDHDEGNTRGKVFGKNNVIAQTAVVSGGLRAISPAQIARAEELMRDIAGDNLSQTAATLNFNHGYPPMAPSPGNDELLKHYSAISEALGYGKVAAVDPRRAGAADISFVASRVSAALDGLGLMGDGGHTVDEVADLRTLPQQTQRVAILLYRIARGDISLPGN
ncbi:M20/M25/M40 family metallo-hydrolase [Congregibacter litoralis]|uniref:Acetylornithine deacetylase/Succinyl-diaminopimelate desuccinylase n=1 Tax=Congregibacter litoralis KT71 TaxID=314285 RepID=A4A7X8_9GAMM|nr:M20/M25/M40 family metallo-hydrolase [Congregibacter litoralis]EAQ97773.2 Acetylornithine deacetylase/Succinyl-diaminopimelate desuccinylase [Congregibacter litoralis KT71]